MSTHSAPIGVFDSGVGGLTVVRALVDQLPCESILYIGDTARVPYGNKSSKTIQRYSLHIVERLRRDGIKALVIACNTASAAALECIRREHPGLPVIGVIEPVCALAAKLSSGGRIGVIGTRSTVRSNAYPTALQNLRDDLEVVQQSCPLFVPLAEEGWLKGKVPREVARTYLSRFSKTKLDTLILGCTHYPLLRAVIEETMAELVEQKVQVLDSAKATAQALEHILTSHSILAPPSSLAEHAFLVPDDVDAFQNSCARFFGAPVAHVSHETL